MTRSFWRKNDKMPGGILPEKLGGDVRHASWNPYPISDQNLWFSLPYFRPDQKFDTLLQTWSPGARRVTSCYSTYTVVVVNIKREMVLSPNDEEVTNSSKKHTQFKTRVLKPYPISDQNGPNWYPISDQNGWKRHTLWRRTYPYSLYKGLSSPPVRKTRCWLWVSLLTQAKLINKTENTYISK